ncbi:MAG TPA: hypothetical protein VEW46_15560 [Pyrinomonadaceae bacterium]|nr:hypothetical protein [Pyrinomonadaceae bacterium]
MRTRVKLLVAIVFGIMLLPVAAQAQAAMKPVADTGMLTLGQNQVLRLTVATGDVTGDDVVRVRFRQMEYIEQGNIYRVASSNMSGPLTRVISNLVTAGMLIGSGGFVSAVSAQPTDAQIKKDLTGPKTVSVVLGKPGTREWSSTYKKYVWNRNFTAKLKTEDPQIFVIVKGYASYDIIGGRFVFWRTFTTSNSYEGLSNPTAADVEALIPPLQNETR